MIGGDLDLAFDLDLSFCFSRFRSLDRDRDLSFFLPFDAFDLDFDRSFRLQGLQQRGALVRNACVELFKRGTTKESRDRADHAPNSRTLGTPP